MPRTTHGYKKHKHSGNAFVRIGGKQIWLGKFGTEESKAKYRKVLKEHEEAERDKRTGYEAGIDPGGFTIAELVDAYNAHARAYYAKGGTPTRAFDNLKWAFRPLLDLHAHTAVEDFGPKTLKAVREKMIEAGGTRGWINGAIGKIKRLFKWGVSEELVPASVHLALETVEGLHKDRTAAPDNPEVQPVPFADVQATLPYLPPVVADMVMVQFLTGARGGEVCAMKPKSITITEGAWLYRPESHKTQHKGRDRVIAIGPRAQAILRKYLDRDPNAYLFQPRESERARNLAKRASRQTPLTPSARRRLQRGRPDARGRDHYDRISYRQAVERACVKAGVPHWHPHRLRHARASELSSHFGIETAQNILGHADPKITLTYAQRDVEKAAAIMAQVG